MPLSIYDIAALVLVLSAAFGWLNRRFIHLPHTIGLLVLGLATSLALVVINDVVPNRASSGLSPAPSPGSTSSTP